MNNKGQSLITFILIIPIIILIALALYDISNMVMLKNELRNISYIVLDYGIDNIDDDNVVEHMEALVLKNKNDIDDISVVKDSDDKLYVVLYDSINTKISFSNVFRIKASYVGYMSGDKKIIERNN